MGLEVREGGVEDWRGGRGGIGGEGGWVWR